MKRVFLFGALACALTLASVSDAAERGKAVRHDAASMLQLSEPELATIESTISADLEITAPDVEHVEPLAPSVADCEVTADTADGPVSSADRVPMPTVPGVTSRRRDVSREWTAFDLRKPNDGNLRHQRRLLFEWSAHRRPDVGKRLSLI